MLIRLRPCLILAMILGLTACGGTQPTATPVANESVIVVGAGDDALLTELVVRVLDGQATDRGLEAGVAPVLRVGALPAEWPAGLALPEGTTVIGSLENPTRSQGTQVFLDVAQPGQAVVDHFTRELVAQGYVEWLPGGKPVFTGYSAATMLCQAGDGIQIGVTAVETPEQPTDVRLTIASDPRFVSCDDGQPNEQHEATTALLPRLTLPPGMTLQGHGGSYAAEGRASDRQEVFGEVPPAELAAHIAPQLVDQGWRLVGEGESGPVAWSEWAVTDADGRAWGGLLTIIAGPGASRQRIVQFEMELQP